MQWEALSLKSLPLIFFSLLAFFHNSRLRHQIKLLAERTAAAGLEKGNRAVPPIAMLWLSGGSAAELIWCSFLFFYSR